MTDDELRELIQTLRGVGTDLRHVEAKRAQTDLPRRLWESLSAFANSPGGGVVILGLNEQDEFAVVGVDDPRKIYQDLGSMCAEMDPRLSPVINIHEIEGKHLIAAEVAELLPAEKPCYHRAHGLTNGAYVRIADGDHKLTAYEVQMMLAARGQPVDDVTPVPDARLADFDPALVAAFVQRVRERRPRFRHRTDEEILLGLRALAPHPDGEGPPVPTIAGLLVFGREPQTRFPEFALVVTTYPGRRVGELGPNGERLLDDVRLEGPIAQMVQQAITAIVGNLRKPRHEAGAFRTVPSELPRLALSEALVNALAHRDLSPLSRGTPVQVQVFVDRVVIQNPGGLFGPVTVDTLGVGGTSSARNPVLMQLLEDLVLPGTGEALAEHRGTGIAAMIEALREAEMSPPRFEDKVSSFTVIFPRQSLLEPETLAWLATLGANGDGLTRDQRMALALMRGGEPMTNVRYRQVSGADSRVATRELGELTARGLAEMRGVGRWAEYTLSEMVRIGTARAAPNERVGAGARGETLPRVARADRRPEIRRLLRDRGPLARAEIEAALGLAQTTVNRWLRVLRADGEVELTTRREKDPGARYRLARDVEA